MGCFRALNGHLLRRELVLFITIHVAVIAGDATQHPGRILGQFIDSSIQDVQTLHVGQGLTNHRFATNHLPPPRVATHEGKEPWIDRLYGGQGLRCI